MIPALALAAGQKLSDLINTIIGYANQLLVLMMGIAVVMFVWFVIQYYVKPNDERGKANMYVMYALIGFFVVLSFWGLVNILQNTFGLQNDTNRPQGWASFTNIFPGGNSSPTPTNTILNQNSSPTPTNTINPNFNPYGQEYNPTPGKSPTNF